MLHQKQQSFAAPFSTSAGSTNSVDIIVGIIWGIILDNPVNFGEIKTSLSYICTQKNPCLSLAKLKVGRCSLLLLLLTMNVLNWYVNIVEQI